MSKAIASIVHDLRQRVLGSPEISTDGFRPYQPAIRSAFGNRIAHGVIRPVPGVRVLACFDSLVC